MTEQMGLERDIEAVMRQIRSIANKNEKLLFVKVARRVLSLLLGNRLAKLRLLKNPNNL